MTIDRRSFRIGIILLLCTAGNLHGQQFTPALTNDPDKASFVSDDVTNFIRAYGLLSDRADTLAVLQQEYFDKGTPGLQMFIEKYDLTAERLLKAMRTYPERYRTLERVLPFLDAQIAGARAAFGKLKGIMPEVVYPPTYFLIESSRGIGSGSVQGQLISIEKWVEPVHDESTLMVHELVHFQQAMAVGYEKYSALFGPEKNLLGLCIREGTAEFFADLVTGRITQDEALSYTLQNEPRLWEWFRKDMDGQETGDWMWKKPADVDQPMHVGYVIGYRIVQAYYENAEDKEQAVREILSVTDWPGFLERSGYARQFE